MNRNNTGITAAQHAAFTAGVARVVASRSPYVHTGTKLLAKYAPLIRFAVKNGLKDKEIVEQLDALPDSPTYFLATATAMQYLLACRMELGIRKNHTASGSPSF